MLILAVADPTQTIGNYGLAGAIILVAIAGITVVYRDMRRTISELRADLKDINTGLVEKVVPAMNSTAAALVASNDLVVAQAAELRVLRERR